MTQEFPIIRKIEKEVEYLGHKVKAEVTFVAEYHPKVWTIRKSVYVNGELIWQRERGVGGIPFEELPEVRKSEEELQELLSIGMEKVRRKVEEERREKALAELWRLVWSRPFGFVAFSEVPRELVYDEEEVRKKFVNEYVLFGARSKDTTPDGRYYVWRPYCYHVTGPVILIHNELVGRPLVGVRVEKNIKGTAWKILPGGQHVIFYINGTYMSRGKWSPAITGFFVEELLARDALTLWFYRYTSRGGGFAETTAVLALPSAISRPVKVAKGLRPMDPRDEVRYWILYSNGIAIDYDTEEE